MSVQPPQLPSELDKIAGGDFVSEATLDASHLKDADLTDHLAWGVSLDEVKLEKVILAGAKLEKFGGSDVIMHACDLSAVQSSEISLLRTAINDSRATGFDCSKGTFKDVSFTGCKLDMANFRFAKLTDVAFVDCILTDADFMGAEFKHVSFENCLLERTVFDQATMQDVDLRTSQLIDLRSWQSLTGATIDNVQLMTAAPYLANELGIKVID